MFEVTPGELLDLIDKGDEIGFRMRGGSVHPSSVSLGIKHGGARVEKRNIKEFLKEFRGGRDNSETDSEESEGEQPQDVGSQTPPSHESEEEDPVVSVESVESETPLDEIIEPMKSSEKSGGDIEEEFEEVEVDGGASDTEEKHVRFEENVSEAIEPEGEDNISSDSFMIVAPEDDPEDT